MISWQSQFVQNDHSTYAWVLDYWNAVLKMTLFDAMLFFLLSLVTLNLLSNPIQVTFIKYLLYSPEVHLKLWWTLSMHADSFPPPDLSLSVRIPVEDFPAAPVWVLLDLCLGQLGRAGDLPSPGANLKQWGIQLGDKYPASLICSGPVPAVTQRAPAGLSPNPQQWLAQWGTLHWFSSLLISLSLLLYLCR